MTVWGFASNILTTLSWIALIVLGTANLYPRVVQDILPRLRFFEGFGVKAHFDTESLQSLAKIREIEMPYTDVEGVRKRLSRVGQVLDGAKILWVDDHPHWVDIETSLLQRMGVVIERVQNSSEAKCKMNSTKYDLILSDIGRSNDEMNEIQLAEWIHHKHPEKRLILYTEKEKAEQDTPAYVFGCTYRPDELFHYILDALERQRLRS